ncbi:MULTISPECIES: prenyltransferase [Salinibaculum]|uniref:prenyltransferase n=1 Tax=Salinibaculum TaxID=2732368 RepID=UPI0030D231EB
MTAREPAWVLWAASRPSQLLLIAGVYALGAKVALVWGASLSVPALLAGLAALLPVAVSVHYANEYADHATDALTDRTPFSGGSGALPAAGVDRRVVLRAAVVALALGTVLAAAFAAVGLLSLAALALLGVIAVFGWQYSVGPLRLAWRGWGELDNAALGGLVLPVYGAAVVGGPLGTVALASVPFFLVVLLNLFATQWPDRRADAAVGKRTLAVQWSRRRLRAAYAGIALAAAASVLLLQPGVLPRPVAAASVAAAPFVVVGAAGYTRRRVPWPTVSAMVVLALAQFAAWCWVGTA